MFDIVADTIKESGYRITTVSNAMLALEHLKSDKYTDLYITDLLLDDMDGLSLIEEMRSIEPNAEIIALLSDTSALSNVVLEGGLDLNAEAVRKMAIESGAHAVFISPFNLGELVEAIHRLSETRTC